MSGKVISFNVSTGIVGTLVQITTIGFRPSFVKFRWTGRDSLVDFGPSLLTSHQEGRGIGLENAKNYCWSRWAQGNADPYSAGSGLWRTASIVRQTASATTGGKARLTRMLDDGFEYEILEQFGATMTIIAEAVSGVEVDAIEGVEPGAAGVQTYSTPFRPTYLEVLMTGKAAWDTPATNSDTCFGAAFGTDPDQQAVHAMFELSGSGAGDTAIYCRRTECLAVISASAALVRATLAGFGDSSLQLDWLERNGARVFVLIVMTGRHFIAQGLTQTNTNPFQLTGMTWTAVAVEMVSAGEAESAQDTVVGLPNSGGLGFSDGFGTGPTERAVLSTRINFDGNTGGSREAVQHEFDELYASMSGASPSLQLGLADINAAFTPDTVELVMDDADPAQFYFFLIAHGPPVMALRERLTRYLHNTWVSLWEGRTIIRDVQGRDLPTTEVQVDAYMFSAGFMFPTPVKRHSNIEENHLHYIESVSVDGDNLKVEVVRESLIDSVLRRLGS